MDKQPAAHFIALGTILVWGTTFIATKILLETFTPIEILAIRFIIGYLTLHLISLSTQPKQRVKEPINWKHELIFAGAGLSGITTYYLLENIALTFTLASNVGIIVSIAPLTTAMLARLFLKEEPITLPLLLGFIIAFSGVALVLFNGSVILQIKPAGDILALLSTVGWAVYSILLKKIDTHRYPVVVYTRKIFFYGILFMLPASFLLGFEVSPADISPQSVLILLFLGVGASALCFVSWNFAVKILGALRTSAYIYLTPLISLATAALVL
ncbi:MAG: EamA family transporter, partial [Spirochaetae bacterium HGW-Spirochaetae-8]